MATHPKGQGIGGVANSHIEAEILKAIGHHIVEGRHIQRAVSRYVSPRWFPDVIGKMLAAGLVYQARVKDNQPAFGLTGAGVERLPKAETPLMANWKPLKRQTPPPRRPGSDAALKVPSMAAGQLMNWRSP